MRRSSILIPPLLALLLTILNACAAPERHEPEQNQALREAASEGDREGVARALAAGAAVDDGASSGTALMYAAYGNHAEIVRDLLEAGAAPDLGDGFGDPAIHWASYGGASAAVDALLAGGADPTIVTHHGDALGIAMRRGFPRIVEALARHTGTGTGDVELHLAARAGDLAAIDRLLAEGAVVDALNRIGYTPLMEAAREGRSAAVERLLAAGADPAHRGNDLGMGMTALHVAADRNQAEVVRILLSHGVEVDAGNAQGTTALAWALGEGALDAAGALLDAGADPRIEDELDFSAIDLVDAIEDPELSERLRSAASTP